jgi:hypothetical protein
LPGKITLARQNQNKYNLPAPVFPRKSGAGIIFLIDVKLA